MESHVVKTDAVYKRLWFLWGYWRLFLRFSWILAIFLQFVRFCCMKVPNAWTKFFVVICSTFQYFLFGIEYFLALLNPLFPRVPVLTVVKYGVNAGFWPVPGEGQNSVRLSVPELSGILEKCGSNSGLTLPNHVRYQLRYTRIFSFSAWYHAEKEKASFSCLWAALWSNSVLREFFNRGISAASYCPKDFRTLAFGGMDRSSILPNRYWKIFRIIFACFASFLLHFICFPSLFESAVSIYSTSLCGWNCGQKCLPPFTVGTFRRSRG